MSKYILMSKKRHKESLPSLDQANVFLAPVLVIVSWYMYQVTRVDRQAFGPLIGEHVSNFFGSALAMYLATALTTAVEKYAEFETVKKLAQFLQVTCAVALVGINLSFEVWEGNTQMFEDLTSAFLAIMVVWASTRRALTQIDPKSKKD